jgi:chromate transporter
VEAAVNGNAEGALWVLGIHFGLLAFAAIGGVAPILPEVHRQVVEVHGWLTSERFAELFAIAQASPGPNFLVLTLIGWNIAGFSGAAVATLAITLPTGLLAFFVGRIWQRFRNARWRIALQQGLVPVTIGLVCASAYVITQAAAASSAALFLTLITGVALYLTRLHPLIFLAAGAILGTAGLL